MQTKLKQLLLHAKLSSISERKFAHPFLPSVFSLLLLVTMTQTCHDALDPNCAKRESKNAPSPGGNRPSAVFSILHTITKLIFDLDWYSHFLSPATP